MRTGKGKSREFTPRSLVALFLASLACGYVAWMVLIRNSPASNVFATGVCTPSTYPTLCSHRIVGDEVDKLSGQPLKAISRLFTEGIYCFDADVVRLADDSLYVAHPLMFKPVIEQKLQHPVQPSDGQSLTDAVLTHAQMLTHEDVVHAEEYLAPTDARPVPLASVLFTYASFCTHGSLRLISDGVYATVFSTSLAAHSERLPASTPGGKPHAAPRLFLEPKQNTYKSDSLAKLWDLVEELELQEYVAVWAMDPAHYDILQSATSGKARVIWGYMDQDFSDQISTVSFPSPVPPQLVGPHINMFGIAKRAPARHETARLGQPTDTLIALWVMDTHEEFLQACNERVDMVITNKPLEMKAVLVASANI